MSSKTRSLKRQQERKVQAAKDKAAKKQFSQAEREELVSINGRLQEAYTQQEKFVNFLRKQHDAPESEGWVPTVEGFVKQQQAAEDEAEDPGLDGDDDDDGDDGDDEEDADPEDE